MLMAWRLAKRIHHIVNKIQQFINQHAGIHFFFFSEIDQVAVYTITAGAPFVFIDQGPLDTDEIQILERSL